MSQELINAIAAKDMRLIQSILEKSSPRININFIGGTPKDTNKIPITALGQAVKDGYCPGVIYLLEQGGLIDLGNKVDPQHNLNAFRFYQNDEHDTIFKALLKYTRLDHDLLETVTKLVNKHYNDTGRFPKILHYYFSELIIYGDLEKLVALLLRFKPHQFVFNEEIFITYLVERKITLTQASVARASLEYMAEVNLISHDLLVKLNTVTTSVSHEQEMQRLNETNEKLVLQVSSLVAKLQALEIKMNALFSRTNTVPNPNTSINEKASPAHTFFPT